MSNPYEDHITAHLRNTGEQAAQLLEELRTKTCPHPLMAVRRWASQELRTCASIWCRPAPAALVALIEHLLGTDKPKRSQPKNLAKFREAAHYLARHPEAKAARIARAIDYDQKAQIRSWLQQREFQNFVRILMHEASREQNQKG